ncbi:MAG: hypothetical protein NT122_07765, partial [Solirubrobacterales bacterium]|nr:hypothetical protein [Solirubrobacterales bacterium]
QRLTSAHAVLGDGTVLSGGKAAPEVALRLRGGQVLKPMAGVSPRLIDFAYQSISSNRSLFGRLLSDKALANAGELIASRTATNLR